MAEEAEHHHDDGRRQDGPEHQPGQAGVDRGDDEVLRRHQHRAGPAVQGPPQLQGGLAAPAGALGRRIRRRYDHTGRRFSASARSRGGGQGVGVVQVLVVVVVMVVVVRRQLLGQIQGLVVGPFL